MVFELVVPARNEEGHVADLVGWARSNFNASMRIIVVDNASDDRTSATAIAAGADEVLFERRKGKGFAVVTGLRRCVTSHVMICDADIAGLTPNALRELCQLVKRSQSPVGRLAIGRPPEGAPVTTLLAHPLLQAFGLDGKAGREPIGGLLLADRSFVLGQHLPGGWGFDIACTLAVVGQGAQIPELAVAGVSHRHRDLLDYVAMAREVCLAVLRATGVLPWDHAECTRCTTDDRQLPAQPQQASVPSAQRTFDTAAPPGVAVHPELRQCGCRRSQGRR